MFRILATSKVETKVSVYVYSAGGVAKEPKFPEPTVPEPAVPEPKLLSTLRLVDPTAGPG